jgi:hypothetical protein
MITCHIASVPARENSLKQVITSILGQVDQVYVQLNGYDKIPTFFHTLRNVKCEVLDNSLTDGAKFLHVNDEPSVCFILDDDLVVARNYVAYMLSGLKKYGGAVSLHGKCYANRPIARFRRSYTAVYRCINGVVNDARVDVIGSGCMAFDNQQVRLDSSVFEYRDMADVLMSRFCVLNNIPMTVLKHNAGQYLRYLPQTDTIWKRTNEDRIQTEICNSFLK